MHDVPLAECLERYKRFDEKIDTVNELLCNLIANTEKNNGKFEKHILESVDRIAQIERHEVMLEDLMGIKGWIRVSVLTVVGSIVAFAILWGSLIRQVEINTHKWEMFEEKLK